MADFTLDTSGVVTIPSGPYAGDWTWERIGRERGQFTQGYVEALLKGGIERPECEGCPGDRPEDDIDIRCCRFDAAFHMLAPETLARIMEDCSHAENVFQGLGFKTGNIEGQRFYRGRSNGSLTGAFRAAYPPLTPYLGDDGLIYLREVGQ